jgi:predicted nucleic acid-binding protein
MIYALDACVLLDIFIADSEWERASRQLLESLAPEAEYLICPEVYAEVAPHFRDLDTLEMALADFPLYLVPSGLEVARRSALGWRAFVKAGGDRRRGLVDFMVAGHALVHTDALITRDRGFYRAHFQDLRVVSPVPPETS